MKQLLALLLLTAAVLTAGNPYLANQNFKRGAKKWVSYAYWGGQISSVSEHNRQYLKFAFKPNSGKPFAKAMSYCRTHAFYAGNQLQIKMRLKGAGQFRAGMLVYPLSNRQAEFVPGTVLNLTDKFQEYQVKITIPRRSRYAFPYIELMTQGQAIVDYFQLKEVFQPGVEIQSLNSMQMVRNLADVQELKFQTSLKNQLLTVCQQNGTEFKEHKLCTSPSGVVTFCPQALKPGITEFSAAAQSRHAVSYVSRETPEAYQKSAALARQIKFPRPYNILVIGDSLSDFFRGYNYIDRLNFWLNKYNGNQVYLKNAGVGGDYITRVHLRLQGMTNPSKSTWRQYMYNGLFDRKYDLIFIFLGQNDTRCWRKDNYQIPLVSPAEQRQKYLATFKILRQHSAAPIVLISPSPSYAPIFLENAKKLPAAQNAVMFGQDKLVDQFDAVNRKICKEQKLDYIDILHPMRQVKARRTLYVEDGVHLSAAGGRLIANEILHYLAGKFPVQK